MARCVRAQTETSIKDYYIAFTILVLALIFFGGYIAPMAEVKLGLGCVHSRPKRLCRPSLKVQLAGVRPTPSGSPASAFRSS